MCDFEIPRLLFYTHIPALIIGVLLAFLVFSGNKKSETSKNLFIFILFLCYWLFIDMVAWITFDVDVALFLTRVLVLTSLALLFFLFFSYSFRNQSLNLRKKILFSIPFWPIAVLLFTNLNEYIIDSSSCYYQYGPLLWYIYLIVLLYTIWSIIILLKGYKKNVDIKTKKQIKLIIGAIIFVVVWFIILVGLSNSSFVKNLPGNLDDYFFISVPIGIVIFIALLTYAITRYQMLHIKLFAAQVLVVALIMLIGSQFFFIQNQVNMILTAITLLIAIIFGWMLIKSVKLEVQRKEELENLSTQLAAANDKLHALDKAKSEFISIASHQLRTPLTSIKGFGSLLLEGTYGEIQPAQRNVLEKIYISNERLIQLVEDLLNISRIDAGKMEFDFQEAQIEDLVQEAVNTLELSAKAKNLYLHWQKPAQVLPKLKIDITKIKEVISNMVDNAIKYTPKGGVTVRVEKGSFFNHDTWQQKNIVRVVVSDTGIGMDKEELESIFNKFERGKEVSRYHTDGTGLGMYIGKKVVEVHKGRIWAESDGKGRGSRFILELPVNQSNAQN